MAAVSNEQVSPYRQAEAELEAALDLARHRLAAAASFSAHLEVALRGLGPPVRVRWVQVRAKRVAVYAWRERRLLVNGPQLLDALDLVSFPLGTARVHCGWCLDAASAVALYAPLQRALGRIRQWLSVYDVIETNSHTTEPR